MAISTSSLGTTWEGKQKNECYTVSDRRAVTNNKLEVQIRKKIKFDRDNLLLHVYVLDTLYSISHKYGTFLCEIIYPTVEFNAAAGRQIFSNPIFNHCTFPFLSLNS